MSTFSQFTTTILSEIKPQNLNFELGLCVCVPHHPIWLCGRAPVSFTVPQFAITNGGLRMLGTEVFCSYATTGREPDSVPIYKVLVCLLRTTRQYKYIQVLWSSTTYFQFIFTNLLTLLSRQYVRLK